MTLNEEITKIVEQEVQRVLNSKIEEISEQNMKNKIEQKLVSIVKEQTDKYFSEIKKHVKEGRVPQTLAFLKNVESFMCLDVKIGQNFDHKMRFKLEPEDKYCAPDNKFTYQGKERDLREMNSWSVGQLELEPNAKYKVMMIAIRE